MIRIGLIGFLLGCLFMGYAGFREVRAQYEARIAEVKAGKDVAEGAVMLLAPDKFAGHAAKLRAARQREGE